MFPIGTEADIVNFFVFRTLLIVDNHAAFIILHYSIDYTFSIRTEYRDAIG